jgi:hypothetical protein
VGCHEVALPDGLDGGLMARTTLRGVLVAVVVFVLSIVVLGSLGSVGGWETGIVAAVAVLVGGSVALSGNRRKRTVDRT